MTALSGLERYQRIAPLGAGGMATVSLAEDLVLGRHVALKRLTGVAAGELGGETGMLRLRREALLGASISHPNLVAVYDVVSGEEGDVVIVMEYVPGETLEDRLRRDGALPQDEAIRILTGVASALDAIHARGIVHRDLKPANVLLSEHGEPKLSDLGVATLEDRTRITQAGMVVGTFRYMAPEQLQDAAPAPAQDIYALAAMAFEMLSGQKARPEAQPLAVAHALATQDPPNLRDAWPHAPAAAAELLRGAMDRDPARRPAGAGVLVADLREAFRPPAVVPARTRRPNRPAPSPVPAARPASAARPSSNARPRPGARRAAAPIAALAAVVAVLALILTAGQSGSSTPRRSAVAARPTTPRQPAMRAAAASRASSSQSGTAAAAGAGASGSTVPATGSDATSTTSGPVGSVETFYHLAAAHRPAEAWALADPTFRAQLGGYDSFVGGQAGDRSITFDQAAVTANTADSATVTVHTTSVRANGTQHCSGTIDLVNRGSWLLHQIHISCA